MHSGEITTIINSSETFDPEVLDAREWINKKSDARIAEITEETYRIESVLDDKRVGLGVYIPEDADTSRWLLMLNPFANGHQPNMVLRGLMLQRSVGEGTHPIIWLPNNTRKSFAYELTAEERQRITASNMCRSNFDLTSLVDMQAAAIEATAGDAKLLIAGYSQGATLAPQLAQKTNAEVVLVAEAPNTNIWRNEAHLEKEFKGKGFTNLRAMNRAVLDSEVPALAEAMQIAKDGRISVKQLLGIGSFALDTLLPVNKMLHTVMAQDGHRRDLLNLITTNPDSKLVLVRAEDGIFKAEDFERYKTTLGDSALYVQLEGYGHEAADNITLFGQLGRQVLKAA